MIGLAKNHQDNKAKEKELEHQRLVLQAQQATSLEAMKMGKEYDLAAENIRADVSEGQSLRDHDISINTGGVLGAFKSAVRPFITYVFFLTFIGIKGLVMWKALEDGYDITVAMHIVWDENTQAIFGAIMGFWFGARTIEKFTKKEK